jgi:hypothetical protein
MIKPILKSALALWPMYCIWMAIGFISYVFLNLSNTDNPFLKACLVGVIGLLITVLLRLLLARSSRGDKKNENDNLRRKVRILTLLMMLLLILMPAAAIYSYYRVIPNAIKVYIQANQETLRGPKGDTGPRGPQGPAGASSASGTNSHALCQSYAYTYNCATGLPAN